MVFYRKYRPQTINELDSEKVRQALINVLSLPEIPHAFLFTGPKGLGKTSAARILAKAVNCESRKTDNGKQKTPIESGNTDSRRQKSDKSGSKQSSVIRNPSSVISPLSFDSFEPCNKCEQCISITNGTNLDILEIDAASNRGIDEIRDLREKIKLTPLGARKKVYIIDEVHMLTTEAFNALLKTLEEPPSHALFILCTTELYKVPETIVSRCFQIMFAPATYDEIARSFKRIALGEGLNIEDKAIEEIAKLADGGFRDGVKILEELTSMDKKVITKDLVEKRYKVVSSKYQVAGMIEQLQNRDSKSALMLVKKTIDQGIDVKQFLVQLIEQIHSMLLEKAGVGKELRVESGEWGIEELRDLLVLLNRAYGEMKYAVIAQLPLELAIIEFTALKIADQNADICGKQNQRESAYRSASIGDNTVTVTSMRKQVGDLARVKAMYGDQKPVADKAVATAQNPSGINLLQISNSEITSEWLGQFWISLISEIKLYNHTIAGVLRGCMIKEFDKKTLIIETAYKFHKERLDDNKTRAALEQACKTLTGNPVRVEVKLKQ
jgi:DNA polymerase III subunit gamma/tau